VATGVQIVFDCADPDTIATFWAAALKNRVHLDLNVGGPRDTPHDERRRRIDTEVDRLVQHEFDVQ